METESSKFTYEDSLKTIYDMINATKNNLGKNYLFFLVWGYLVSLACISEYILIRVVHYPHHYQVWPILMGIGLVISGVLMISRERTQSHTTFIGNVMNYLWAGWFVSFSILIFFLAQKDLHQLILPVTLVMYGMGMFISGGVISFRPLLLGGVVSWTAALIACFQSYDIQLLLTAVTVVISYIIPGHMLRNSQNVRA